MINVLIIEDHPIVVEGLKKLLIESKLAKECLTCASGREAQAYLKSFNPDIVLLDINLPDVNGIDLCKIIKTDYPDLKILAISSFGQRSYILRMMENGAMGYVLKNAAEEEIISAIKDVANGEIHIGYDVNEILNQAQKNDKVLLTRRELEVLKLIADGFTNQEIADKIFVSPLTVDSHRKNLLMKLNARNTAALIKIAIATGLISAEGF